MKYMVEPIGARFSNKDLAALAEKFSSRAAEGYRLHSVFQVAQPGCLGMGQPIATYIAVYEQQSPDDKDG